MIQQSLFFCELFFGLWASGCLVCETVNHEKIINRIISLTVIILSSVAMASLYRYMK